MFKIIQAIFLVVWVLMLAIPSAIYFRMTIPLIMAAILVLVKVTSFLEKTGDSLENQRLKTYKYLMSKLESDL